MRLLIILVIFCFFSCDEGKDKSRYFTTFESEYSLKHELKAFTPHYYGKGTILNFTNNKLFIHDLYSQDSIITVYSTKSFKKLGNIGTYGQEPGHILQPGSLAFSSNKEKLFLVDNAKGHIVGYDIDSALNQSDYLPSTFIPYPSNIFVSFIEHLEKDIFITRQLDINTDLLIKFKSENIIDTLGKWYQTDDPIVLMDDFTQYYYGISKHPKKERYVSLYTAYDVIQVTDSTGNSTFTIGPEKISYKDIKNEYVTYSRPYTSDDYIFASYIGEEFNQLLSFSFSNIHVFDWEGNPIAKFNLDIPLLNFTIDIESRIIYGLADNENRDFVTFKFPKL